MPYTPNDRVVYRDGREEPQRGRIQEVRDEGPHAVYRIRNDATGEIQVITREQIAGGADGGGAG
ncbi:hypothetical protein ACYTFC_01220 [Streptomyces globosus]|uniref:hypothetical protein n=1 Tax=Streptomyces sp. WAC05292 TaxID=2487418 RepID=UPI000F749F36|nr:hypothetical protein [Streptomyces sp. WAC05292]RSS96316.1 hypothetical protein EF903_03040 [Streptomyces sp. WAC05292]